MAVSACGARKKVGKTVMSNKRYEVNTPGVSPVDRDVTKLLYVSTAKYGATGTA